MSLVLKRERSEFPGSIAWQAATIVWSMPNVTASNEYFFRRLLLE